MTPEEITQSLEQMFGETVQRPATTSWQIETDEFRLLVLLSDDESWLRLLIPIVSAQEAEPFFQQLLESNFDLTQETHYALYENVVWGVFQHQRESLTISDFSNAVKRLVSLHEKGLNDCFNQLVESRLLQIIQAAKMQGQSLEATLQTLERFYQEGLMGDMQQGPESREAVLTAWRYQLERLWNEIG